MNTDAPQPEEKKKDDEESEDDEEPEEKNIDLTQMDGAAKRIMILLLIHLLQTDLKTQDMFEEFIFVQSVKR